MNHYRISDVTKELGFSPDTLRYYEKIALLKDISRSAGGMRFYTEKDLLRLRFIRRAKTMNFSLKEITDLLDIRDQPEIACEEVRELTRNKLTEIEERLKSLTTLRNELEILLNLCIASKDGCPIIKGIDDNPK